MKQLFRIQKYISLLLFSILLFIVFTWYFGFHKELVENYQNLIRSKKNIQSELSNNQKLAGRINSLNDKLNLLNENFESLIISMPPKSSYDKITTSLFNLIQQNGLKIKDFSPSNFALETKTIIKSTGEEILVEKIPIDIEVTGSFIDFGKLLDSMKDNYYRFTASDIDIEKEGNGINQRIKFIAYLYLHEITYSPPDIEEELISLTSETTQKIKKAEDVNVRKKVPNKQKNKNRPNDAPEDIPDWMFEPITETDTTSSEILNNDN